MDSKEKQKFAKIVVFVVIGGLVLSYVPLFFAPSQTELPSNNALPPSDETANLVQPQSPPAAAAPSPKNTPPEGFSGIEEEDKSLEELNKLLENQ